MKYLFVFYRSALRITWLVLCVAASLTLTGFRGQTGSSSESSTVPPPPQILLEVVNKHFTVGKKIPSVYLRLFSDGTAECHVIKSSGYEKDTVKTKRLQPKEFAEAKAVLDDAGLQDITGRYELPRLVFDSLMEWDLGIHDSDTQQNVTVSFAGPPDQTRYPDALGTLGCLIVRLRGEVYGDNTDYYRPACTKNSSK